MATDAQASCDVHFTAGGGIAYLTATQLDESRTSKKKTDNPPGFANISVRAGREAQAIAIRNGRGSLDIGQGRAVESSLVGERVALVDDRDFTVAGSRVSAVRDMTLKAHSHRLIFKRARGMLMAVAETAVAHGNAPGSTVGGPAAELQVVSSGGSGRALAFLRPAAFAALLTCGAQLALMHTASAQVVAYKAAPASQRPTVLSAGNGVPLVNIQTPSAAGVSRNTYEQFDVQTQGVILNNSRTNTSTQLGGWVQGNPWLARGSARVILNEVISANPSQLMGYVEVAGSAAQVVIANPAGVTCNGCGFINASRATLTTGTPIVSSNLDGYRVEGGTIRVEGAGMDASRVGYTDLIARAVEVNAGIWAQTLKVTTGTNVVDAGNAQATPIAAELAPPLRSPSTSPVSAACTPARSCWLAPRPASASGTPGISVPPPARWWSPSMAGSPTPARSSRTAISRWPQAASKTETSSTAATPASTSRAPSTTLAPPAFTATTWRLPPARSTTMQSAATPPPSPPAPASTLASAPSPTGTTPRRKSPWGTPSSSPPATWPSAARSMAATRPPAAPPSCTTTAPPSKPSATSPLPLPISRTPTPTS
ncbi:MAG: filamentous hemagglutinin N-terminal domain-containing protein [Betaproteobacteria bacterium]|nr:filamentous hemagglutinin N-terminal domain-containing protein [Betaproteobacteria bacterium]